MEKDNQNPQTTNTASDGDWRSHVAPALKLEEFPFEPGERVWVLKTGFRAPLGPFTIHGILPHNKFELKEASGKMYQEPVDGSFLKRQPF